MGPTVSESSAAGETPEIYRPPHVVTDSDKTAGVVSRGIAAAIDVGAVWTLLAGAYLGLALVQVLITTDFRFPSLGFFFTATGFIVVSIAYNALCWAISGRTLGCVVMGLRVRGRKRDPMRPAIALARAVFYTFVPIGLLWAAVDLRRRSVPDIFLGTRVVYSRKV